MPDNIDDFDGRVRARAFELWQEAGCPEERANEFWHKAREIETEGTREDKKLSDPSEPSDPSSIAEF